MIQEHVFITYIRTKQLLNERLRYQTDNSVSVHESDLNRFGLTYKQLNQMLTDGLLQRTEKGIQAANAGTVDLSLIKPNCKNETDLHRWMKQFLLHVDLPEGIQAPDYFNIFLRTRNEFLNLFFKADDFSGRVHTPVSNLHRELRPELILMGEPVTSLDVSQMQPTLLGNILLQNTGKNAFSDAINEGRDVYVMLQSMAGLNSREEAKKLFFRMLFGKPNNDLAALFSDGKFMDWINRYKSIPEPRNPKSAKENYKIYNNLSWLLQSYEVFIMSQIWQQLAQNGIPFLSVHDEIIIRQSDTEKAYQINNMILSKHFKTYKLNSK